MQPSYLVSVFVKGVLALSVLPSILASDPAHAVRTPAAVRSGRMAWGEDRSHPELQPQQERRDAPVHLAGHPVPPVRFQSRGRRDAMRLAVADGSMPDGLKADDASVVGAAAL